MIHFKKMISPIRIFLLATLFIVIGVISQVPQTTEAQFIQNCPPSLGSVSTPYNIHGWLWSSNIGWVLLNCSDMEGMGYTVPNFGVNQDASGNWIGYGWSSNVGWIKFNAGCPQGAAGSCNAKVAPVSTLLGPVDGLVGWAKFLSASGPNNSGWDGWVSLSSTNDHNFNTSGVQGSNVGYGPVLGTAVDANGCKSFNSNGYTWGDDVVGWLAFSMSAESTVKVCDDEESQLVVTGDSQCFSTNPTNINVTWSEVPYQTNRFAYCYLMQDINGVVSPVDNIKYQSQGSLTIPFTSVKTIDYTLDCYDTNDVKIQTSVAFGRGETLDPASPQCTTSQTTLSGGGNMCATGSQSTNQTKTLSWQTFNSPTASYCKVYQMPSGTPLNSTNYQTTDSVVVGPYSAGTKDFAVLCFDSSNQQVTTSNTETVTILPTSDSSCVTNTGSSGTSTFSGGGTICPSSVLSPSSKTLTIQAGRPAGSASYESCVLHRDGVPISSPTLITPGQTISTSYIASSVGVYDWRCYPAVATPNDPASYDSNVQNVTEYCAIPGGVDIASFSGGGPLCPAGSTLVLNNRTLLWNVSNATSCNLRYPDGSTQSYSYSGSGSQTGSQIVSQEGDYILSCTDGTNTDTATVNIYMQNINLAPCNGQSINTRPQIREI